MASKRFPQDYVNDEKQALATGDKIFIFDAAGNKNGIIDASNLGLNISANEIDGFKVRKGLNNTANTIEIGDRIAGWLNNETYIVSLVTALPYTDNTNRLDAINSSF